MKFIIVKNDDRVLCQMEPRALHNWLDIRVAEATDWRYALRFETRRGAERCAFMSGEGANVHTIGEWENDTEANRRIDGRPLGARGASNSPRRGAERARGTSPADGAGRPDRNSQVGRADVRRILAGRVVARLPPVVEADWRARQSDARLNAIDEFERVVR